MNVSKLRNSQNHFINDSVHGYISWGNVISLTFYFIHFIIIIIIII